MISKVSCANKGILTWFFEPTQRTWHWMSVDIHTWDFNIKNDRNIPGVEILTKIIQDTEDFLTDKFSCQNPLGLFGGWWIKLTDA